LMMMKKSMLIMALAALMAITGVVEGRAQLNEEAVEFTERLGEYVPGDITLIDEDGQPVNLGEFVDKPTILMNVYFSCPGICTPLLTEVADILGKSNLDPTKTPFQLLAVSFDPEDTPQVAKEKRANYLKLVGRELPEDTWRFFTADQENIDAITGAVGFRYKTAGMEYTHPGGLIILSPDRKIVRYLYGLQFLPFDFQMGIHEASEGRVMPTTARLLKFCFSYDPDGRKYVFNLARVIAVVMITSVVLFLIFLIYTTRGKRGREASGNGRR
jgi:protein SCO1/2